MPEADPYNPYSQMEEYRFGAEAPVNERVAFIKKTYAHLIGAVVAFVALQFL